MHGKVPRASYVRIKEKTAETARLHYDLTGCNIMRFGDRYSLSTSKASIPVE